MSCATPAVYHKSVSDFSLCLLCECVSVFLCLGESHKELSGSFLKSLGSVSALKLGLLQNIIFLFDLFPNLIDSICFVN